MSKGFGRVQRAILRQLLPESYQSSGCGIWLSLSELADNPELRRVHRVSISRAVIRLEELEFVRSKRDEHAPSEAYAAKYTSLTDMGRTWTALDLADELYSDLVAAVSLFAESREGPWGSIGETEALAPVVYDLISTSQLTPFDRSDPEGHLSRTFRLLRKSAFDWNLFLEFIDRR